jgi:hypothetical protein
MVSFMVMVKRSNGKIDGLGFHKFAVPPLTGEYVTMDDEEGIGQAYRVKAVIHPLELTSHAGDLYLEYVSTDLEFITSL